MGKRCDPVDGSCRTIERLTPCIAIIDESDNYSDEEIDTMWANFRTLYPLRQFCLLQPQNTGYRLHLPDGFVSDTRATWAQVNRDNGDPTQASDWFTACGLGILANSGIDFVGLFIDESGSMTSYTVSASLAKFEADLTAASLTYCEVYDSTEDWITPFSTTLGEKGGGGSCS